MTTESATTDDKPTAPAAGLKKGAIGIVAVIFMAVANAAPITAMTGNVPIAVGFGNGLGAPAGFLFATIILTLFALGYVAMARHITTTGAFYGFISHGLGQVWGMASGMLATFAYVVFEGSLIGGCAYFANDALNTIFGVNVPWLVFAIVAIVAIAALCYFHISLTAAILGVTLTCEVLILLALAFSVIFSGGGPDGFMLNQTVLLNNAFESLPAGAFGTAAAAGSMAIGLFFAFWSWVGFETTAVYGEESRNPKKIIPQGHPDRGDRTRPVLHVHLGDGVRRQRREDVGRGVDQRFAARPVLQPGRSQPRRSPARRLQGPAGDRLVRLRAGLPQRRVALPVRAGPRDPVGEGASHHRRRAPQARLAVHRLHGAERHHAGDRAAVRRSSPRCRFPTPTALPVDTPALVPYVNIYGLLALIGTAAILLVQAICSAAVIWYFWVRKTHRGNVITTLICPLIGGVAMLLRGVAAVGQPRVRRRTGRELRRVQGRPVHDRRGVPDRPRSTRCGCAPPSLRSTPRSAAP